MMINLQNHAVKLGPFFIYNGNRIKIIHHPHKRRQYKVYGGDCPCNPDRHKDIAAQHKGGQYIAQHGRKGNSQTFLEHPVFQTWQMAAFPGIHPYDSQNNQ